MVGLGEWENLLENARAGQIAARNEIIKRFQPLVIKTASSLRKKFIDSNNDDEISIGLMAIDQAIDTYNPCVGTSFIGYAEIIIKRRLIDYYRREQRHNKAILFSSLAGTDNEDGIQVINQIEYDNAVSEYLKKQEEIERREEIRRFTKKLKDFGITFNDLVIGSPKHEDARIRAIEVAKLVSTQAELKSYLLTRKELPLKKLEKQVKVSRKTLERQRKYIISVCLIILGEFYYLREYLHKVL